MKGDRWQVSEIAGLSSRGWILREKAGLLGGWSDFDDISAVDGGCWNELVRLFKRELINREAVADMLKMVI